MLMRQRRCRSTRFSRASDSSPFRCAHVAGCGLFRFPGTAGRAPFRLPRVAGYGGFRFRYVVAGLALAATGCTQPAAPSSPSPQGSATPVQVTAAAPGRGWVRVVSSDGTVVLGPAVAALCVVRDDSVVAEFYAGKDTIKISAGSDSGIVRVVSGTSADVEVESLVVELDGSFTATGAPASGTPAYTATGRCPTAP